MTSSTGWDANRSRLPGTYGQAGHMGISPAIILKSRAEVPLPCELKGILRTKGATDWPVQPLAPRRPKVPDYQIECREWEWA